MEESSLFSFYNHLSLCSSFFFSRKEHHEALSIVTLIPIGPHLMPEVLQVSRRLSAVKGRTPGKMLQKAMSDLKLIPFEIVPRSKQIFWGQRCRSFGMTKLVQCNLDQLFWTGLSFQSRNQVLVKKNIYQLLVIDGCKF